MKFPDSKYNLDDRILFYDGEKKDLNLRVGVIYNINIHTHNKKIVISYILSGYKCYEDDVVRIFE